MTSTDADFRRRVERDALAAGWAPDLASMLAKHVGRGEQPRASVTARAKQPARRTTQPASRTRDIDRLCAQYGAPGLARDFKALRGDVPLPAIAAMLSEAAGTAGRITPAGVAHVRFALMAGGRTS